MNKIKTRKVAGIKRIFLFAVLAAAAIFSATSAAASGRTALDQLFAEAGAAGAPAETRAADPAPACLSAGGTWTACPAYGDWSVPNDIWKYLVARSSSAAYGNGGVPRRIVKLAAYYTLEFSLKEEVRKYYGNAGAKKAALAEFAGRRGTRVLSDGQRIYFVSGRKVLEVRDAGLAAAAGKVMSGVSRGNIGAAVGCAMNAGCWSGLGETLDAHSDWVAGGMGKEEEEKEDPPEEEG